MKIILGIICHNHYFHPLQWEGSRRGYSQSRAAEALLKCMLPTTVS